MLIEQEADLSLVPRPHPQNWKGSLVQVTLLLFLVVLIQQSHDSYIVRMPIVCNTRLGSGSRLRTFCLFPGCGGDRSLAITAQGRSYVVAIYVARKTPLDRRKVGVVLIAVSADTRAAR